MNNKRIAQDLVKLAKQLKADSITSTFNLDIEDFIKLPPGASMDFQWEVGIEAIEAAVEDIHYKYSVAITIEPAGNSFQYFFGSGIIFHHLSTTFLP